MPHLNYVRRRRGDDNAKVIVPTSVLESKSFWMSSGIMFCLDFLAADMRTLKSEDEKKRRKNIIESTKREGCPSLSSIFADPIQSTSN